MLLLGPFLRKDLLKTARAKCRRLKRAAVPDAAPLHGRDRPSCRGSGSQHVACSCLLLSASCLKPQAPSLERHVHVAWTRLPRASPPPICHVFRLLASRPWVAGTRGREVYLGSKSQPSRRHVENRPWPEEARQTRAVNKHFRLTGGCSHASQQAAAWETKLPTLNSTTWAMGPAADSASTPAATAAAAVIKRHQMICENFQLHCRREMTLAMLIFGTSSAYPSSHVTQDTFLLPPKTSWSEGCRWHSCRS